MNYNTRETEQFRHGALDFPMLEGGDTVALVPKEGSGKSRVDVFLVCQEEHSGTWTLVHLRRGEVYGSNGDISQLFLDIEVEDGYEWRYAFTPAISVILK